MSLGTSNRDGGKTSESGHLRALGKMVAGDILEGLAVSQRAAGANMSVDIAVGDALIRRSDGSYSHPVFNDAVYNQVIAAADGSNPRRDIVVIYVDYGQTPSTAVSNNTNGVVKIKVVAGTPAGSPTDPSGAAIQSSVGSGNPYTILARVRVPAGQTSIGNSLIDDLRVFATPNMSAATKNSFFNGGWLDANEAWSYSSWTSASNMGVITVPTDATTKYNIGQWVRFVQSTGGTKFGKIIALTSTTITVWTAGLYTLNNEAITAPYFSREKVPAGLSPILADGNPYTFSVYCSIASPPSITTSETNYAFNTKTFDYANSFNTSTYVYVVPVTGVYEFSGFLQTNSGFSGTIFMHLRYNAAASIKEVAMPQNGGFGAGGFQIGKLRLVAGDSVAVRPVTNSGSVSVGANLAATYTDFSGALITPTA